MKRQQLNLAWTFSLTVAAFFAAPASGQEELPSDVRPEPAPAEAVHNRNHGASSDHLTVTQWVQPKTPGVFKGRVVVPGLGGSVAAVASAEVALLGQNGWSGNSLTNSVGKVTITDVKPGTYAVVVRAPGIFTIYAMHVVAETYQGPNRYPESAEIACSTVDARGFESIILPQLVEQYSRDRIVIQEAELNSIASQVRGNERYRVLRKDGDLVGTLYAAGTKRGEGWYGVNRQGSLDPASRQIVFLVREGQVVGEARTDESGGFVFSNVPTGLCSILSVGRDGVLAVGFELTDSQQKVGRSKPRHGEHFVATPNEAILVDQFAAQVIPFELGRVIEEGLCCCDLCCEAITSGVGGGGGGVAGGGLGGLAAAAAIAAAAAAGSGGGGGGGIIIASPSVVSP